MKERAAIQAAGAGQQTAESGSSAQVGMSTPAATSATSTPGQAEMSRDRAKDAGADRGRDPGADKSNATTPPGLTFPRFFTAANAGKVDPFDEVEWELRSALIGNERGEVVFEQRDVEIPKAWSQQATNIVVSKYFRGQIGTPERERSVKQLIGRVVDTITLWG